MHHWYPVLLTDESRFTLSISDRCETVWRSHGGCHSAFYVVQHDPFGGGSVSTEVNPKKFTKHVSVEGPQNSTCYNVLLTAISHSLSDTMLVWREYAHTSCRMKELTPLTGLLDLHLIDHIWGMMFQSCALFF